MNKQRAAFIYLVLFCGIVFLTRFYRLGFHSLWYDELTTALVFGNTQKPLSILLNVTGSETLHPLYYIAISFWGRIIGTSELMLRLPSAVFSMLAIPVYWKLFKMTIPQRTLLFFLIFLLSPFLIWYARDARPYALILLLSGLHFLYFLRCNSDIFSRRTIAAYVLTGMLLIYSGFLTLIAVAAEALVFLITKKYKQFLYSILIILIAAPLIVHALNIHYASENPDHHELPQGFSLIRFAGIAQEFFVGRTYGPTSYEIRLYSAASLFMKYRTAIIAELAVIMLLAVALLCRSSRCSSDVPATVKPLFLYVFSVFGLIAIMVFLTGYRLNARHIAFVYVPMMLCILFLLTLSSKKIIFPVLCGISAIWSVCLYNQLFNPKYMIEDFRGCSEVIEHAREHKPVIAMCHSGAFEYYAIPNTTCYIRAVGYSGQAFRDSIDRLGPDEVAWIVISRPWDYAEFELAEVDLYCNVIERQELSGIFLFKVQRR